GCSAEIWMDLLATERLAVFGEFYPQHQGYIFDDGRVTELDVLGERCDRNGNGPLQPCQEAATPSARHTDEEDRGENGKDACIRDSGTGRDHFGWFMCCGDRAD